MNQGRTYISGMGVHHPDQRVTNNDLAALVDTSHEWIRERTGILERRYAAEAVNTSDLGVLATGAALQDAGWDPEEIELLICATSTPDALIPSTASYICNKMELGAVAFDVNAACSGFLYGLAVAQGMMAAHDHDRVALCTAEKYSRVIDPSDRSTSVLWGDGAATVLLQSEAPKQGLEVVDIALANRNEGADLVRIPINGYFEMNGPAVKEIALSGLVESTMQILDRNGVTAKDLRALVCHQANLRMIEVLAGKLGMSGDRHWHNVELFGNQGAAGVVAVFADGIERYAHTLRDGELFLLTVYGSGFTGGSALLRWVEG